MPRKIEYVTDNMKISKMKVLMGALRLLDADQPIVVVGRQKGTSELYVASTDSAKTANSLMTKAMNFLRIGYEKKEEPLEKLT